MAVPAKLVENEEFQDGPKELLQYEPHVRAIVLRAAELYGLGYSRKQIAPVLVKQLYADKESGPDAKLAAAKARLRHWEQKQWFRDLVWDRAVVELDMSTPQILRGVLKKAKRGRVDAAKLALGITGRYKEKDDSVPAAVTINLNTVPRPKRQAVEAPDEIVIEDGEVD